MKARVIPVAVVTLLMAACTTSARDVPVPPTQPASPTSPSTSISLSETTSPKAAATESATSAVVKFWAVLDALASDPKLPLTRLSDVARDQARLQWQRNLTLMRGKGQRQVGVVSVLSPRATYDATTDVYRVSACIDVSKVNVVDGKGKSVVSANRTPRVQYTYDVVQDAGEFYVTADSLKGKPC